ncbi:MAG: GAF domain-containing protein [Nitrospira sp.]|nr:GAF domain-containing protein [Nitrospira sp.]
MSEFKEEILMGKLLLNPDKFFDILNTILSTLEMNELLTTVVEEIQSIIKADRCTLYLIDRESNELYSKVLQADSLVEIRMPLTKNSLAGFSAITRRVVNVKDAHDDSELKAIDKELSFDKRWDKKSGYRTKSVLVMPIPAKMHGEIIGVFQALNSSCGFTDVDVGIVEQFSYLLGIAVKNALLYQIIEEEKKLKDYIIDDIDEGVCIIDTKKRVISANRFLEVMSGKRYPVQEMIGEYFYDIFPNLKNTQLEEKMNEVLLYGFKKVALLEVLEVKIIPYHDDTGRVKRLILIFTPLESRSRPDSEGRG